uniref:Uncharacterized protein n=1 Tax=Amphimedon queenslandica TaxID=400682 RepID=A0A1X7V036_AMPQE
MGSKQKKDQTLFLFLSRSFAWANIVYSVTKPSHSGWIGRVCDTVIIGTMKGYQFLLKAEVHSVGQQCSAASTWRCLGSLVATTASDAKSTTYKKNRY